jgi:hypothetical protein
VKGHPALTGEEHVRFDSGGGRVYVADSVPLESPGPNGELRQVEVKCSRDGGQTWIVLPMRLSVASRVRYGMFAGWPPERTRSLGEEDGTIWLEYDNEWVPFERPIAKVDTESRWRATFSSKRQYWTLKRIAYIDYESD